MSVLVAIALIAAALAVPLALLDGWLTLRARRRRRDAVDDAFSDLLFEATCVPEGAGRRTARR